MKRSEAVHRGAPLVFNLEEAAMEAVRSAAAATVGLIDLRREANLSATVGADAWDELFAVTGHLHQGLRASIAFHRAMDGVKTRIGCRTVANGGKEKEDAMEEMNPMRGVGAARALHVVG